MKNNFNDYKQVQFFLHDSEVKLHYSKKCIFDCTLYS